MKKRITILFATFMIVLTGCSLTPDEYTATSTFTVPEVPEVPEVPAVPPKDITFTTATSGTYVIGQSPSEYVTGNEVEFTTSESGNYVCGTDFPAGTYDIESVSGTGNVMSSGGEGFGLNEIMGSGSYGVEKYDNYTFVEGETLKVSGVSVKLVPQSGDKAVIEPGVYDLVVNSGTGNVMSSGGNGFGLNEIMGGTYGVENFDNYEFVEGEVLTVTGVSIDINGKTEEIPAVPAVPAVPAYDIEESATYNVEEGTTTYYQDGEEVSRDKMNTADDLDADIQAQIDATESE